MFSTVKTNPGPGQYNFATTMTNTGSNYISKYKSSGATVINPKKSARFPEYNTRELKANPGPGEYSPKQEMSKTGEYFISKLKNSGARSHYHYERDTLTLPQSARINPGPGTYQAPSDFG